MARARRCLELLGTTREAAFHDATLMGFQEAADFAGVVEDLSRSVDYLQLVAAVERTRRESTTDPADATDYAGLTSIGGASPGPQGASGGGPGPAGSGNPSGRTPAADADGFRNTAEFLRARLRIGIGEARRRLSLAESVLPRLSFTGQHLPPQHEEVAGALAGARISSRAATVITMTVNRAAHHTAPEAVPKVESALTRTAIENDHDFLARIARRWADATDQDGAEPSEEELRHRQGAFLRKPRRGLHHVEIFATTEQYENLLTVMNAAANPRTSAGAIGNIVTGTDAGTGAERGSDGGASKGETAPDLADHGRAGLDLRSRPQKLLDGLVGACQVALTSGTLPANGGLRPQIMVTIDHRDLLGELLHLADGAGNDTAGCGQDAADDSAARLGARMRMGARIESGARAGTGTGAGTSTGTGTGNGTGTGTFVFSGPITASTIRKIACDADILPTLLGTEGRILDVGRATRIFPPHIRKAITARDQGCAFPNCSMPAPWCESHHITYWSQGGSTSTDNGVLLCSHHHHLIHKEQWQVQVRTGIPWFIPPPHLDPHRKPRRNHHHRT